MQRIPTLLQKISELSQKGGNAVIEIDLMLDYTRVLYADLLEMRNRIAFNESLVPGPQDTIKQSEIVADHAPEKLNQEIQQPEQELKFDIRNIISINDKYQFISELFGNDKDKYYDVLDEINRIANYEEAKSWLKNEISVQQGWNNENMTVQMFYDVVSQFFSTM